MNELKKVSERLATATPVGTCNRIGEERHKGLHFKIYDTNQSGPPFPCLNFVAASERPVEAPSQCQITVQDVVWLVRHKLTVGPVLLPAFRECARERITECLDALQQIQQDGWKRPSWVDSTRAAAVEAPREAAPKEKHFNLVDATENWSPEQWAAWRLGWLSCKAYTRTFARETPIETTPDERELFARDCKLDEAQIQHVSEYGLGWSRGWRARAASSPPQTTPEYPKPCGICNGVIESKDDLDWHGYGNCRDIPDIVMADLNIAELLRDLQGHVAGKLGERLDKAISSLATSAGDREPQNSETRKELIERLSSQVAVDYEFDGDTNMANIERAIGEAYDASSHQAYESAEGTCSTPHFFGQYASADGKSLSQVPHQRQKSCDKWNPVSAPVVSHGPLLEAFKRYGRHSQDCDSHAPLTIRDNRVKKCTCGFEAVIALVKKE